MSVTVAHDYCTQRGGAERVALALLATFSPSTLVTGVHNPAGTFAEFGDYPIRTSALQGCAPFRRDPRLAYPLLAAAWSRMRVTSSAAVVCSSSGWSHGVSVEPGVAKVVYCHNPARWLYQPTDYLCDHGRLVSAMARQLAPALRRWDHQVAESADLYVANSTAVARRIRQIYGITAQVVNPPSAMDPEGPQEPVRGIDPGYLLSVGRGRGYKHLDTVCRAVERAGRRLVVVGGSDRVEAFAHVTRLRDLPDAQLRWLYANAEAVVSLSHEDFGLTPVEGFGFGTPAVVLGAGGFLDSMVDGVTGVLVAEASEDAFLEALERLPQAHDRALTRAHARRFALETFQRRMWALVTGCATGRAPAATPAGRAQPATMQPTTERT
jgi:glycosyltransferase involved in cell wall biosynthesis